MNGNQRQALLEVERGQVRFSKFGQWEPNQGRRRPSTFDWLDDNGFIKIDGEGEPVGKVIPRYPVVITDKGKDVLHPERGEEHE